MKELTDQYARKNNELVAASGRLTEAEKRSSTDAFMKTESDILKDQLEMLLNACPDSVRQMYSATIPNLSTDFRAVTRGPPWTRLSEPSCARRGRFSFKPPPSRRSRGPNGNGRLPAAM